MIEVFFRYRVHPSQTRAFEHAYGPTGPWSHLFARHPGYRRTRLFRHQGEPGVYITVDVWESKGDYDIFRSEHSEEYARLDRDLAMLHLEEHSLGYYEGTQEYQASVDTSA